VRMRPAENGETLSDAKRSVQRGANVRVSTRGEDADRIGPGPAIVSPLRKRTFAGADRLAQRQWAR